MAADIRDVDASEGYVVGVVGPWGSGKTSILNMLREALQADPAIPVIDFNPWIFSGTDELIEAFFRELSAQMRLKEPRIAAIADAVDAYSELVSPMSALPVVGAWIDRVRGSAKALKKFHDRRKGSVNEQREKLAAELTKLDQPIVVVIDDIDRLESPEIRDIFKLVRLLASFPNTIYVLAFDRARVEDALTQAGFDGRAYLEKIVQLGVDVPVVPAASMLRVIGESLETALNGLDAENRFDEDVWPDVLMEIIRPLIKNMRDVNRYCAALRTKARLLGAQIELVDVMALEAIRVFLPSVFAAISAGREGLTTPSPGFGARHDDTRLKAQIEAMVAAGTAHPEVVQATIARLFPAAARHVGNSSYGSEWLSKWLQARRVAHPDVLALYLEQSSNEGLRAFSTAERAFAVFDDQAALDELLRGVQVDSLEDVISALEGFEDDYDRTVVVPASRVLLNILPILPERQRGLFGIMEPRFVVTRVVLRLLNKLDTSDEVMTATRAILAEVEPLASQFELVTIVGHREGAGHELVSAEDATVLEAELKERLLAATSDRLAQERDILRILYMPKTYDDGSVVRADPDHPGLARAVLLDAQGVVRSQVMGNRRVHRTTRLNWEMMVEVLGGEDELRRAIETVRPSADEQLRGVIELAERYLSGWRPSD